jgi:DNA-binding MarR family transcriptional regulator
MMAYEVSDQSARYAVWQAYLQIHAVVIQLLEQTLLAEQDLPLLWYNALERLANAEGGMLRLQELADDVNLSQSGLTRLLDRMIESGLIVRQPCPKDRRGLYAVLTERGSERLQAAQPVYQRVLDEHFLRYLSCDEVQALNKVFANIVQHEIVQKVSLDEPTATH